jgi:hypothetical protein
MRKIILTENQYKKLDKFVNEQVNDNRYHREVKVDVYYRGKIKDLIDDVSSGNITINYLIEAEYRSWGIKDISLYDIKGPSEIELDVTYYDSKDDNNTSTKTVIVPLNWDVVEKEEETGMGIITVGDEISIHVTENENNDLHCVLISVPVKTL